MKGETRTIAIFAKPPLPGKTKSRIAAIMGEKFAVDLSRAMLLDLITLANKIDNANIVIFHTPDAATSSFEFTGVQRLFKQVGNDLGERMSNAFSHMFNAGVEKAVIVGSDCVTISSADIEQAFISLDTNDAVFKPASDGGYMLVGLNHPIPQLFRNIDWGTSSVMRETLKIVAVNGIDHKLLSEGFDVDIAEDLVALKLFLKENIRCHTSDVLHDLE